MENNKKATLRKNHKFLVTAICISTLGAQFTQVSNVKAASEDAPVASSVNSTSDSEGSSIGNLEKNDQSSTDPTVSTSDSVKNNSTDNEDIHSDSSPNEDEIPADNSNTDKEDEKVDDKVDESNSNTSTQAPIVHNNPDATESSYVDHDFGVYTTARVSVSNENGVTLTQTNETKGAGADIIDDSGNVYDAVYTLTNINGSNGLGSYPSFFLPGYYENNSSTTHVVMDSERFDEAAIIKAANLPSNTILAYGTGTQYDDSYDMRSMDEWGRAGVPDFDASKVTHIYIRNRDIPIPDGLYTIVFPLKVLENDPETKNGIERVGSADMSNVWGTRSTTFHIINAPETDNPDVDPDKGDGDSGTTDTKPTENHHNNSGGNSTDEETDNNESETTTDNSDEDEIPVISPNEPNIDIENPETKDTDTVSTNNTDPAQSNETVSQESHPVYQVKSVNTNDSKLQGYTMNKLSDSNTSVYRNTHTAVLPQTGNVNNSKVQLMGMAIITMIAAMFGIDLTKKRQKSL